MAFSPIYIHDGDILTDETAKEILALDRTGQNLCHWKQHHGLAGGSPGRGSSLNGS